MNKYHYAALLNILIVAMPLYLSLFLPLCLLTLRVQTASAAENVALVAEAPPIAMTKPMTLPELANALRDTAGATLAVRDSVYTKTFSAQSKIFIGSANSLPEFIDMISQAAGVKWRIADDGVIELYRDGVPGRSNAAAMVKIN
jgi:hypothetical protein